jgi:hypothetical protein
MHRYLSRALNARVPGKHGKAANRRKHSHQPYPDGPAGVGQEAMPIRVSPATGLFLAGNTVSMLGTGLVIAFTLIYLCVGCLGTIAIGARLRRTLTIPQDLPNAPPAVAPARLSATGPDRGRPAVCERDRGGQAPLNTASHMDAEFSLIDVFSDRPFGGKTPLPARSTARSPRSASAAVPRSSGTESSLSPARNRQTERTADRGSVKSRRAVRGLWTGVPDEGRRMGGAGPGAVGHRVSARTGGRADLPGAGVPAGGPGDPGAPSGRAGSAMARCRPCPGSARPPPRSSARRPAASSRPT